jgi:hypothetical protein
MYCSSVSLEDFLSLSEKAQSTTTVKPVAWESKLSCEDSDSFDADYDSNAPVPSQAALLKFIGSNDAFLSGACNTSSSSVVRDKHDLNWCSPLDYISHWNLLPHADRSLLRKLILSDTVSNSNRYGLKVKNLETHLLLNIGCDMNNIVNNGRCSVLSNLKSPSDAYMPYSNECLDNRAVDAKTCLRAYKKYAREFDPSILFKAGFVCYQAVVSSDSSYRSLTDFDSAKENYHKFFKSNADVFAGWLKRKKIYSYMYSHEVSVDSIVRGEYRPHTHLIFFVPKEARGSSLQEGEVLTLEEEFNSLFGDRSFELLRTEVDEVMVPKKVSRFEDVERAFNYLHNCYSLAPTYMREVREGNIRSLNLAAVECYRNLVRLFKNEEGLSYRPVRRFNSSSIPKRSSEEGYVHPLLQKKKKSNTITKVTVSRQKTLQHAEPSNRSTATKECHLRNEEKSHEQRQPIVPAAVSESYNEAARRHAGSGNDESAGNAAASRATAVKNRRGRTEKKNLRSGHKQHACSEKQSSLLDESSGEKCRTGPVGRSTAAAGEGRHSKSTGPKHTKRASSCTADAHPGQP